MTAVAAGVDSIRLLQRQRLLLAHLTNQLGLVLQSLGAVDVQLRRRTRCALSFSRRRRVARVHHLDVVGARRVDGAGGDPLVRQRLLRAQPLVGVGFE